VVWNLVANARDAMPQGGTLTITTANVELDETWARRHVGALPGPYVMITVSDTGVGMDAVTQACIFEPFFTTKAPGAGAGMGLATVYGFVKQSGGHIEVSSQPDHGATFTVYLPRLPETGLTETAPEPVAPSAGSTTVLLVEDDAGVRTLARMVLEEQGYMVLEAPNAEEAWRLAGQYRGTIHLLLTDVVMPGMSGHELVRRLSPLRQEMKVLYMSGYLEEVVPPPDLTAQGVAFLQKPFTPETLADTVRAVLRVQN
jgi:CheY-like chemotaxis protein